MLYGTGVNPDAQDMLEGTAQIGMEIRKAK